MAYAIKTSAECKVLSAEYVIDPPPSALSTQDSALIAIPLTGLMDPKLLLSGEGNTIIYEQNQTARKQIFKTFSTNHSPESASLALKHLLCCLPLVQTPDNISYDNVFRIIIMQFLDPHNFDVRSVKKTCVHIAHPDGRIIPFDTYNLFYRDGREEKLNDLRKLYDPMSTSLPILQ